jgi:hypothetical protein
VEEARRRIEEGFEFIVTTVMSNYSGKGSNGSEFIVMRATNALQAFPWSFVKKPFAKHFAKTRNPYNSFFSI